MEEIDVFKSLRESVDGELAPIVDEREAARLKLIADHKAWLKKIKKEHPSPYQFFKVGVYIRYFNQTKYENYLDNHKMQFIDLIQSCPNWTLVDFYVLADVLKVSMDVLFQDNRLQQEESDIAEAAFLLQGCNSYEKEVIVDTIFALKTAMREHKRK